MPEEPGTVPSSAGPAKHGEPWLGRPWGCRACGVGAEPSVPPSRGAGRGAWQHLLPAAGRSMYKGAKLREPWLIGATRLSRGSNRSLG